METTGIEKVKVKMGRPKSAVKKKRKVKSKKERIFTKVALGKPLNDSELKYFLRKRMSNLGLMNDLARVDEISCIKHELNNVCKISCHFCHTYYEFDEFVTLRSDGSKKVTLSSECGECTNLKRSLGRDRYRDKEAPFNANTENKFIINGDLDSLMEFMNTDEIEILNFGLDYPEEKLKKKRVLGSEVVYAKLNNFKIGRLKTIKDENQRYDDLLIMRCDKHYGDVLFKTSSFDIRNFVQYNYNVDSQICPVCLFRAKHYHLAKIIGVDLNDVSLDTKFLIELVKHRMLRIYPHIKILETVVINEKDKNIEFTLFDTKDACNVGEEVITISDLLVKYEVVL